jgi:plastocyanin
MSRAGLIGAMVVAGGMALAGCGGSSSSTTSAAPATTATSSAAAPATSSAAAPKAAGGGSASISADPSGQLAFSTKSLHVAAGHVKISFTNSASLPHNLTIAAANGSLVGATPTFQGGSKTLSVTLKPGTYTFYCSVPGHRQAGMQGTLTVS